MATSQIRMKKNLRRLPGLGLSASTARKVTSVVDAAYPAFSRTLLADLSRVASIQGGGSIAGLSDVTDVESPKSGLATQITLSTSDKVLRPAAHTAAAVDMSNGGSIVITFKPMANVSKLTRFYLSVYSDTAAPTTNYIRTSQFGTSADVILRTTSKDDATAGRYQSYSVSVAQFIETAGTGANLAAIRGGFVTLRDSTGTCVLRPAEIFFYPPARTKAVCLLAFDDGFKSHINYVAPTLAANNMRGNFFPSPVSGVIDTDVSRMTTGDLQALQAAGHQVGSQAWDTENATIVDAAGVDALSTSFVALRAWQAARGLTGGGFGSYFSNVSQKDAPMWPAFRDAFKATRTFYNSLASGVPMLHGETFPFGDPTAVRAISGVTATAAQMQLAIDQAIANQGVVVFGWHDDLANAGTARTDFETVLAYLAARTGQIEVVTEQSLRTTQAIPDSTNFTRGPYLAFAAPWGKGSLVPGTDFSDVITTTPAVFPNATKFSGSWPSTNPPLGVWGYMAVSKGNYDGGAPSTPMQPVQVSALGSFVSTWELDVGSGDYGGLHEFFMTSAAGDPNTKTHEIALFYHLNSAAAAYFNSGLQLGTHVNGGITWKVQQQTSGSGSGSVPYIAFVPNDGLDVTKCSFDWKSALAFLQGLSKITGTEWVNGVAFGVEPHGGAYSMTLKYWNVDVIDTDVASYVARLATKPNSLTKQLVNNLVSGLKADGVWSVLDSIKLECMPGATDWQKDLKKHDGTRDWVTRAGTPVHTDYRGTQYDGVAYVGDGNAAPGTGGNLSQNVAALWAYIRSDAGVAGANYCGNAGFLLGRNGAGTSIKSRSNDGTDSFSGGSPPGHSIGHVRSASGQYVTYRDGVSQNTVSVASTGITAAEIEEGRAGSLPCSAQFGALAYGGLTAAQLVALDTRMRVTFLTAMGAR